MTKRRFWLWPLPPMLLASAVFAATLTVAVEKAAVKKRPKFYAPSIGTLRLGDQLEAGEAEDGWYPISYQGRTGWLHQSALGTSRRRVGSRKWGGSSEATADEITLAGKGFNESVEQRYRREHGELDFAAVDRMTSRQVSDEDMTRFLEQGDLVSDEAGP